MKPSRGAVVQLTGASCGMHGREAMLKGRRCENGSFFRKPGCRSYYQSFQPNTRLSHKFGVTWHNAGLPVAQQWVAEAQKGVAEKSRPKSPRFILAPQIRCAMC